MKSPPLSPFDALCRTFQEAWPPRRWTPVTVLVAVSGGADSVALARVMTAIKRQTGGAGQLILAHYHHALRGDAADADQAFVAALAEQLGWRCAQGDRSQRIGAGVAAEDEATMRDERYAFLAETAHQVGARYVATAHTQQDNVETMLHHLFRGTGPAGLAGMPPHRELAADVVLIRPLLAIDRQLLRDALQELDQPWREDATNRELRWKRNWIRHALLPQIETEYPAVSTRLATTLTSQRELIELLDGLADRWIARHCRIGPALPLQEDSVALEIVPAASLDEAAPPPVIIHALRQLWDRLGWPRGGMRETHWRRLCATLEDPTERVFALPGCLRVCRTASRLMIAPPPGPRSQTASLRSRSE